MQDPMKSFQKWYSEELDLSSSVAPSACCLSTIGEDGYPNARYVSLKDVDSEKFTITGSLNSRKGKEIAQNPKASLTFWWAMTARQVRIQGDIQYISDPDSEEYFHQRSRNAQLVSTLFNTGEEIGSLSELHQRFEEAQANSDGRKYAKPRDWAGLYILPKRIEFMVFARSRLHERTLYVKIGNHWDLVHLQP